MSIVELPTFADIFYNPHGGILAVLLKGVKKRKKREKDNNKVPQFVGLYVRETCRPTEIERQ